MNADSKTDGTSTPKLPDEVSWPTPPGEPQAAKPDFAKMFYQAKIDEVKARYQAQIDDVKARWRDAVASANERTKLETAREDSLSAAEDKLREAVHSAYLEVAKGALERSLQRANFVTAAAGAIGTSYAGLLALVYSVSAATPNPLPARGFAPAFFLGLSLLLSAFYVAYVHAGTKEGHFIATGIGGQVQERRMLFFIEWVTESMFRRAWALRMSVVSLGVGLILTPLPFIEMSASAAWIAIIMGGVILVAWAGYERSQSTRL